MKKTNLIPSALLLGCLSLLTSIASATCYVTNGDDVYSIDLTESTADIKIEARPGATGAGFIGLKRVENDGGLTRYALPSGLMLYVLPNETMSLQLNGSGTTYFSDKACRPLGQKAYLDGALYCHSFVPGGGKVSLSLNLKGGKIVPQNTLVSLNDNPIRGLDQVFYGLGKLFKVDIPATSDNEALFIEFTSESNVAQLYRYSTRQSEKMSCSPVEGG